MSSLRILFTIAVCLTALCLVSRAESQIIGVYEARKLETERERLESRAKELWQMIHDRLMTQDEKIAIKHAYPQFPTLSPDGNLLNCFADSRHGIVTLPIHSLLLIEDACTAYAWLYQNGYNQITINEYASMLHHSRPGDFPGGRFPPILRTLGIPDNALADEQVQNLSLRFRNSAWAYILAHEMGHIMYRHPGNSEVPADESQRNERQADEFALRLLRRDKGHIPIGAILFFQMTAFISSPGRFDYSTVEEWRKALREATHPVTSDRVRALAQGLHNSASHYGANLEIALDIAAQLKKIADEMDDRDWQLYFRRIGESADITILHPRNE